MSFFEKIKFKDKREIKIFGFPILQFDKNNKKYFKFFPAQSLSEILEKEYKNLVENLHQNYDDIYILWNNTGETWQFLRMAKCYFKKNNSKKPFFIIIKPYIADLIKMLTPDIPYLIVDISLSERIYIEEHIEKLFNNVYLIFPLAHFYELEANLQQGKNIHFFDAIVNRMELSKDSIEFTNPVISKEVELSVLEKTKKINLNIDNFIFIAPEAQSNKTLSENFWTNLQFELNSLGYDTYFNIASALNTIDTRNRKCLNLTIEEGLALAKYSKAVIGIRSGFMEILLSSGKPVFCIYTAFLKRCTPSMSADKVINGFSLKNCPNNNTIKEYNADIIDENILLSTIINDIKLI